MSDRQTLADIRSPRRLATILLAVFAASFRAGAAVETFTESYPLTPTDYNNVPLAVPQFDSAAGQLESITITATGTGQFTQYYQNLSTSSGNVFTMSQTLDLLLSLPASGPGSLLDLSLSSGIHTYSTQPFTAGSIPNYSAPSGGISPAYSATDSSTPLTLQDASSLSEFTGTGSMIFLLSANGSSANTETTGNFFAGGLSSAGLTLTVAYDYLAAPETSNWPWLGGLCGLGALFLARGVRQQNKRV